jgi:hypothetical protein
MLYVRYSDRYYDDNDWLVIDLCDYYALTKDPAVLERAEELHRYIYSGWDEVFFLLLLKRY